MIHAVVFDDEIKIWWEYVALLPKERFCVYMDGKRVGETRKSHFNCKGLTPSTVYSFSVEKLDAAGACALQIGSLSVATSPAKRNLDVTMPPYNAVGDGKTCNTAALQAALNDCKADERVYIPRGVFMTGALDMPSNTELYLEDDAILQGTDDVEDYLPKVWSRFEGTECLCYRSLINTGTLDHTAGCTTENIVIRGGKIMGGGEKLRRNTIARERIIVLKENGLEGELNPPAHYASVLPGRTRGRLICCNNTKNVLIANSVVGDAPSWNLQFTYCEDVVTCSSTIYSHNISNGDGWDPDSAKNCVLFDIFFDTGDDCVAIKSGKNLEGYEIGRPSEHIRVFDCVSKEGHGLAIGSEMSGGIRDVAIWNCDIQSGTGFTIKSTEKRGGYVKDVRIYNCNVPLVSIGTYTSGNNDGVGAPVAPVISNIHLEDLTLNGVWVFTGDTDRREPEQAIKVGGLNAETKIRDVSFKNITMKYRQMMPYQMVGLSNVENLTLENIVCKGEI